MVETAYELDLRVFEGEKHQSSDPNNEPKRASCSPHVSWFPLRIRESGDDEVHMALASRRNRSRRILGIYRLDTRGVIPNTLLQSERGRGAGDRKPNPDLLHPKDSTTPNKEQLSSLSSDSDDYSNKLDKDAQVWKVYVNETDKHDTELVNSWNDSTDVILIFAALFSAISTAFIVESTKLLRSDPAEESAQSLRAISQTLASIVNASQLPGSTHPLSDEVVGFTPPRSALVVNILWYLSLSLSLVTSFIAILVKDWCHSFISGRSGHPYAQARRRQQKWTMIEKWKMPELLTLLPSLIHVALVLFSIGLCIHLWEIHALVAVPVIFMLVLAFGFYAASSVAATVFDHFPYPTIVSRLCRAEHTQWIYQRALRVGSITWFVFQLAAKSPYLLALCVYHFVLCALLAIVWFGDLLSLTIIIVVFGLICDSENMQRSVFLVLVMTLSMPMLVAFLPFLVLGFWRRGGIGGQPPNPFDSYCEHNYWRIKESLSEKMRTNSPRHDLVTGQALSWLIKNCEVPQSVDVALQSIASINKQFPRQPLEECNATLEILRRLASSDLYRAENAHMALKLYSQALSALGPSAKIRQSDDRTATQAALTIENIETTIWDLQALAEKNLVALITDGKFQPDAHNLEAFRIGSTFVPHSLKLLRRNSDGASPQFSSIIDMLENHLNDSKFCLHESTLFLLVNAAVLLGIILADESALVLRKVCRRLVHKERRSYSPQLKAALTTCVLLQDRKVHSETPEIKQFAEMGRRISALVDWQSASSEHSAMLQEVALLELLDYRSDDLTTWSQQRALDEEGYRPFNMLDYNNVLFHRTWASDPSKHSGEPNQYRGEKPVAGTVGVYLQAFHSVYSVLQPREVRPYVYVFVLEGMCLSPSPTHLLEQCGQLLDVLPIPEPSREFIHLMKERNIFSQLQSATKSTDLALVQTFFAASQLWLLHVLQQTSNERMSEDLDIVGLRCELGIKDEGDDKEIREQLIELVTDAWETSNREIVASLGVYAYRLMESLHQSSKLHVPSTVSDGLRNIPRTRRGLSAMMGRPPPPAMTLAQLRREVQEKAHGMNTNAKVLGNDSG